MDKRKYFKIQLGKTLCQNLLDICRLHRHAGLLEDMIKAVKMSSHFFTSVFALWDEEDNQPLTGKIYQ